VERDQSNREGGGGRKPALMLKPENRPSPAGAAKKKPRCKKALSNNTPFQRGVREWREFIVLVEC